MISGLFYIAVTILFYFIFKPAGPRVSFIAAVLSLAGIAIGPLSLLIKPLGVISPLVFFGFYCTLIGYLIFRSTFLPKFLGVLMVFAGLGWFTFVKPVLCTITSALCLLARDHRRGNADIMAGFVWCE
jgi:1,4-dihydroxy-2-naphthoate octaprenyltransferase